MKSSVDNSIINNNNNNNNSNNDIDWKAKYEEIEKEHFQLLDQLLDLGIQLTLNARNSKIKMSSSSSNANNNQQQQSQQQPRQR
jgi:hypothetical protein